jgi:hypothetical protein
MATVDVLIAGLVVKTDAGRSLHAPVRPFRGGRSG